MSDRALGLLCAFGYGLSIGLLVADFSIHLMGWNGPQTFSMIAAFVAWTCLFIQMAVSNRRRRERRSSASIGAREGK